MKKNKSTIAQRKSAQKRAQKRSARLKKTQSEKHLKKAVTLEEKKSKEKKFRETMDKMIQARYGQ